MPSSKVESRYPVGGFQAITPGTTQTRTSTSSSAQSSAIGAGTTIVRLVCTEDCHVAFGSNPTATTSSMYLPANTPEYFGVTGGHKVAVIRTSADGVLHITEGA